ncbi:MgpC family cytadherence protein [Mycoplasmoides genitalium]
MGKGTAMQGSGGGVQDTFSFVVPYSGNHSNQTSSGTIKTAYPVKKDQKSTVKINSLINATPLNSYGYRYIFLLWSHPKVAKYGAWKGFKQRQWETHRSNFIHE